MTESEGKTLEQMMAFNKLALSGMRRIGWAEGEPLSEAEIEKEYSIFRGVDL